MKFFSKKSEDGKDANWRILRKIDKIKQMNKSSVKRNHILKLLADEIDCAAKVDSSFFKAMEMELDTDHQAQVNAALEQFMAKANMAKRSEQIVVKQIFKRKEALETKLFKMKYAKLLRTLTD